MSSVDEYIVEPLKNFYKESAWLVKSCSKPDAKEFLHIARATGKGFLLMGFIGFFVKVRCILVNMSIL
jgi:protein transport protein SEC61 subunit gamma and related proteins